MSGENNETGALSIDLVLYSRGEQLVRWVNPPLRSRVHTTVVQVTWTQRSPAAPASGRRATPTVMLGPAPGLQSTTRTRTTHPATSSLLQYSTLSSTAWVRIGNVYSSSFGPQQFNKIVNSTG